MNPVALLTPSYGRDLELCTLLYGSVGRHVSAFASTSSTPCVNYWDQPKLSRSESSELLRRPCMNHVIFSLASFWGTPVRTIRAAIEENTATHAPFTLPEEATGLAALC